MNAEKKNLNQWNAKTTEISLFIVQNTAFLHRLQIHYAQKNWFDDDMLIMLSIYVEFAISKFLSNIHYIEYEHCVWSKWKNFVTYRNDKNRNTNDIVSSLDVNIVGLAAVVDNVLFANFMIIILEHFINLFNIMCTMILLGRPVYIRKFSKKFLMKTTNGILI